MKKFINFLSEALLLERGTSLSGASNTDKGTMHEYAAGQALIKAANIEDSDEGHMNKFEDSKGRSPKQGHGLLTTKMGKHAARYQLIGEEAGQAIHKFTQDNFPDHEIVSVSHTPGGAKDVTRATGVEDPENTKPDLVVTMRHKKTGAISHLPFSNKLYGGETSSITWDNRPSAGFDTRMGMKSNAMNKYHTAHLERMEDHGFGNTGARGEQGQNNERYKRQFRDPVDNANKGIGKATKKQREVKDAVDASSHFARSSMARDVYKHLHKLSQEAGQETLHNLLLNHLAPPTKLPVYTITSIDDPKKDKNFTHKITNTHDSIRSALANSRGKFTITHNPNTTSVHVHGTDEHGNPIKIGEFSVVGKGEKFSSPEIITKIHPKIAHPVE
jgi:hypothetical protein